jgi:hypothetical protein
VLGSEAFRDLLKGKGWKDLEKAMKSAAKNPQKTKSPKKRAAR